MIFKELDYKVYRVISHKALFFPDYSNQLFPLMEHILYLETVSRFNSIHYLYSW